MKQRHKILASATMLALLSPAVLAKDDEAREREVGRQLAEKLSPEARQLCVFDHGAPADSRFSVVSKLKVAKGTYGGVKEILPELARDAIAVKADALVDYNSSQRFGFWPWRMVRPVVTATAIRWREAPTRSCEEMGGVRLEAILLNNRSPEDMAQQQQAATPPAPEASAAVR